MSGKLYPAWPDVTGGPGYRWLTIRNRFPWGEHQIVPIRNVQILYA